jgi:hypothetical protein
MISKLISASHSVKVLGDLIKAATELNNYNEFVAAVSEVNAKLMQTQSAGLLAQEKQSSLSDPVAELEKDIRGLKHWDTEADRYQLSEVAKGVYALRRKPGMERGEPQHMLCAHCAGENRNRSSSLIAIPRLARCTFATVARMNFILGSLELQLRF